MTEIWKDIKGYKGIYMVSNMGRVKSLPQFHNSNSGGYYTTGKILKQRDNGRGYSQVRIYKKHFYVHRLVAETFIDNPYNLPIVNHKDENPSNNRVDNLEWCTQKYNMNYGNARKKISKGHTNNPILSKQVIATDILGNIINIFPSANEASRQMGVAVSSIVRCCNNMIGYKTAGGLSWQYI